MELTTRDQEILDTLARRVRLLTLDQVQREWWPEQADGRRSALRRLEQLAGADYLSLHDGSSHPEIGLPHPAIDWKPGDPSPNFAAVSYRLQSRWKRQPPALTRYAAATTRTVNRFGGWPTRLPKRAELTHDVHLAAVYLQLRRTRPELAGRWMFEEAYRRLIQVSRREKLPDAVITTELQVERVIEFGGAYAKRKLAGFHAFCARKFWPYEIW